MASEFEQVDDQSFINPQSPYAIAKIKEEKLLYKYQKTGLNITHKLI